MHNCLFCYLPLQILEKKSNKCLLLPTLNSDFSSSQVTPNHPVCTLLPASERTGFPSPCGAGWDPNYKACSLPTQGSPVAIECPSLLHLSHWQQPHQTVTESNQNEETVPLFPQALYPCLLHRGLISLFILKADCDTSTCPSPLLL